MTRKFHKLNIIHEQQMGFGFIKFFPNEKFHSALKKTSSFFSFFPLLLQGSGQKISYKLISVALINEKGKSGEKKWKINKKNIKEKYKNFEGILF